MSSEKQKIITDIYILTEQGLEVKQAHLKMPERKTRPLL